MLYSHSIDGEVVNTEVKKTPDEWQATEEFMNATIMDPDGWRNTERSWDEPITRKEFIKRRAESTVCTIRLTK